MATAHIITPDDHETFTNDRPRVKKTWYIGRAKKYPLKNFANILNNRGDFYITCYTLVTQSISRKPGKFYCIMYRTDKTALLLIMETWRFDVIKNCRALIAFKKSANIVSVNTLALFCGKISRVFPSATY